MAFPKTRPRAVIFGLLLCTAGMSSALPSPNTNDDLRHHRHDDDPLMSANPAKERSVAGDILESKSAEPAATMLPYPVEIKIISEQDKERHKQDKAELNFDCGFTVNSTDDKNFALFTEYSEADFVHAKSIYDDTDWSPVHLNLSCGQQSKLENVVANPLQSEHDWIGQGQHWGDAGVQLVARNNKTHAIPITPEAAIRTKRDDMLHGSFRAALRNSYAVGTFATFSWISNQAARHPEERIIGYMFPSAKETESTLWAGSLQNLDPCLSNTSFMNEEVKFHLVESAREEMHEYRFDWLPDRVDFYIDGAWVYSSTDSIPTSPGAIEITLWANKDQHYGPVLTEETVMTVAYAKLYFNTTLGHGEVGDKWHEGKCQGWDLGQRTAPIPSMTRAPRETDGKTFFFSNKATHDNDTLDDTDMQIASQSAGNKLSLSSTSGLGLVMAATLALIMA